MCLRTYSELVVTVMHSMQCPQVQLKPSMGFKLALAGLYLGHLTCVLERECQAFAIISALQRRWRLRSWRIQQQGFSHDRHRQLLRTLRRQAEALESHRELMIIMILMDL